MATSLHMVGAIKSSITQCWNAQDYFGVSFIRKVCFEYDALGRRTLKETQDTCYRYAWDGNVLLHEWSYSRQDKPRVQTDELGRTSYDIEELHTNLVTWVYDGSSYTPVAKLTEEDSYTIVQDYRGTPIQALDSKGEVVWDCLLDIYGDVLTLRGERGFVPFRFQGQYEDEETGLYYNRFRYYSPHSGNYISQDPIRLAGNNPILYAYTHDSNWWIDPLVLDEILTSGIVYRGDSRTLNNLTPAFPKDATTRLSTFVEKPTSGKYQAIDIAKLQNTGLEAVKDGRNHVSIRPANDPDRSKLAEWAKIKGTKVEHDYSKAVKNACI